MCGIIGIVSKKPITEIIIEGLKRLEYRGYDSAGIATIRDGKIESLKVKGKIANLEEEFKKLPINGHIGIGHTRWATHGAPTSVNAHPHQTDKVAVVHNGIIENYLTIKSELEQQGIKFNSETDTEVIPRLITHYLDQGLPNIEAAHKAFKRLEGAFAIAALFAGQEDMLVVTKKGAPLTIGYGENEMYAGSDAYALAPLTKKITYLMDGDIAEIYSDRCVIYDQNDQKVEREIKLTSLSGAAIGKGEYRHFMLKEIHEQPNVIADTLSTYSNQIAGEITLPNMPFDLAQIPRIYIIACGTSYYSGMIAKYWYEDIAGVGLEIEVASEFRYRNPVMEPGGLAIFISQSGETADTLAAMEYAKKKGQHILSIVNVPESSIARASDVVLQTIAGPEIGVASTKAYTAQLTVLACLGLYIAKAKNKITKEQMTKYLSSLIEVPARVAELLKYEENYKEIAHLLAEARDILYIGRGTAYAIALEGALKLKELSYIHAEAIAAGELKHGTIALIDENVPVVAIAPNDHLFGKTASNIQEVAARGGKIVLLSDKKGAKELKDLSVKSFEVNEIDEFVIPFLYVIPLQLIAYYVAMFKGTDIDQPRNLAKSVTVE
jgi:glucosamine--fructose-6-phosphate aminotransferase (isomerizing)